MNNHIYFSDDEELAGDMKDKAKLEDEKTKKEADEKDIKGVPDFWLTIFKVNNYSQVFLYSIFLWSKIIKKKSKAKLF